MTLWKVTTRWRWRKPHGFRLLSAVSHSCALYDIEYDIEYWAMGRATIPNPQSRLGLFKQARK
ncbi:hypothetical protein BC936DRAFT_139233 [Jimgerdemannia flammicorona]|uniref:Uncharacterized protein n=2 Tax=Jimgerdemannia flammicorona TaxID=994334 RepID=A0A433QFG3_9FUNG|nr:hypothetical protein BC936DRAFT_139233 [Jimgerdemannia flammicorona]RUS28540.1 hypothetical protein BC938DRAFT_481767 [Jimgerdemannia flammicorona]